MLWTALCHLVSWTSKIGCSTTCTIISRKNQSTHSLLQQLGSVVKAEPSQLDECNRRRGRLAALSLGGHLKSGHTRSLQNRPYELA
jgi:hypothetical protein